MSKGLKGVSDDRQIRVVGSLSVFCLLAILILTIAPLYHKITSAEATTGTPTLSTLTFTSTSSTASVSLIVNSPNGTFATSSDGSGTNGNNNIDERAKFSISTNNYTGYTLTIRSSSSNNATTTLVDSTNNNTTTNHIDSITSTTSYTTFSANNTTGQAYNNKWGYIPNYYNSSANTTNYYPSPTTTSTILQSTSSANALDGTSNPDNYTIGLGLRADYTNPSGTYTNNTFILEYVANPIKYSITFTDNTGDNSVSSMPAPTGTQSTSETSITLPSSTPTRTGYTFSGWCSVVPKITTGTSICIDNNDIAGTTFTAGGSFGIDQIENNTSITLYALWTPNTYTVAVNFAGTGVSSVTFTNATYGTSTVSTTGGTASLKYGASYETTMNFDPGYEFVSWALNNANYGTLSSTSTNPTTFIIKTSSAVITATGKITPTDLTINFDAGVTAVIVKKDAPDTGTLLSTVSTTGTTITSNISAGSDYYIIPLYDQGKTLNNLTCYHLH